MRLSVINAICENLDAKRPYLIKALSGLEDADGLVYGYKPDDIINLVSKADPVAVKSNNRKTPFINQILKWLIDKKIRLPEDIDTVKETLIKYSAAKSKNEINKNIEEYDSPGEIRKELSKFENKIDRSYDKNATLVKTDGEYKLYRIDNFEQGRVCFADSGWCVQNENYFNNYKPPYFMVVKGNKRYALMHEKSRQVKDVNDDPLSLELAKPIEKLIKTVWPKPRLGKSEEDEENDDGDEEDDLSLLSDLYPMEERELDDYQLFEYALKAGKRMPKIEEYALTHGSRIVKYAINCIKGRWPEAEPLLLSDRLITYQNHAVDYAVNILKDRWPELESKVDKFHTHDILKYAVHCVKGRWPEGEKKLLQLSGIVGNQHFNSDMITNLYKYAKYVIKGRWKEVESTILRSPIIASMYTLDIMGGEWPEAEAKLANNYEYQYYLKHPEKTNRSFHYKYNN